MIKLMRNRQLFTFFGDSNHYPYINQHGHNWNQNEHSYTTVKLTNTINPQIIRTCIYQGNQCQAPNRSLTDNNMNNGIGTN